MNITSKEQFSSRKSEWLRRVAKVSMDVESLLVKVRAGSIITVGDVYRLAYRVYDLGEAASPLAERGAALDMRDHVLLEIRYQSHALEEYSDKLAHVLMQRRMSDKHFPHFLSLLTFDAEVDMMHELDDIMGN